MPRGRILSGVRIFVKRLDVMDYDPRWGRYRVRLVKGDVKKHEAFLTKRLRRVYEESN